ncbi:TetR family transcriptional regulator [Streptomyces sp. DSM 44915]|uniref:TetR family transcriptional regulator n=1 Tax=Streptomyces chisholmiae TaxID=3075540 RepID=A0ABU2JM04_9ACTN|nr:TetR family transcriptional regulator [Streptomyces sp. DSM 44915]MDT0266013.1 TetR family transcriptional regulator [Streptomyces sp. DSM 44915]
MTGQTPRADRASHTRDAILTAAERLFAERGVVAVSSRQISEAAGQGNNTAVGYHFGGKAGLVRAIVRRHADGMDALRAGMLAGLGDSTDVREWCDCLVRPSTEYLATLGGQSWYARFAAQVMTDPVLREDVLDEALGRPTLRRAIEGLNRCLPALPPQVRLLRVEMARTLLVHSLAERERVLAQDPRADGVGWSEHTTALVDVLVGLWLAPATPAAAGRPLAAPARPGPCPAGDPS